MEITFDYDSIKVNDGDMFYIISIGDPTYLFYKGNSLYLPFINEIISNIDTDQECISNYRSNEDIRNKIRNTIVDNHEEIKRQLFILINAINLMPELVLCDLTYPMNNSITFNNGDHSINYVDEFCYYPINKEYRFKIVQYGDELFIGFDETANENNNLNNYYRIGGKLVITNQPFDAESFAETIRTYASNHLIVLLGLFKPNKTKSARLI